jgi:aminopeptidase
MARTVHFAIGYPHYQTDNGNESLVHWDLIVDMHNGGQIYFDDVLVQQDGIFVVEALKGLNFDNQNSKVKKKSL